MKSKSGLDIIMIMAIILGVGVVTTSFTESKSDPYANQIDNNVQTSDKAG